MKAIDQLCADDFTPFVGKTFRPAGTDLDLVLTMIDQRQFAGWEAVARKPFSLILRGAPHPILPEGFYQMLLEDGPELTLYAMPILTPADDHQDYQIVFN
jgi:hypothetical protein